MARARRTPHPQVIGRTLSRAMIAERCSLLEHQCHAVLIIYENHGGVTIMSKFTVSIDVLAVKRLPLTNLRLGCAWDPMVSLKFSSRSPLKKGRPTPCVVPQCDAKHNVKYTHLWVEI